jgi:protein-S-isoprenylcysteine O-methyltransferase Ste14
VPLYAIIAGDALTALCFYITFLVYKENTFTSAAIEIAEDQKVIFTGPYAFVRHPMYAGGALLFIGTPVALGSYWGLLAFVAALPALIWRLLDEEMFLSKNLQGYEKPQERRNKPIGVGVKPIGVVKTADWSESRKIEKPRCQP